MPSEDTHVVWCEHIPHLIVVLYPEDESAHTPSVQDCLHRFISSSFRLNHIDCISEAYLVLDLLSVWGVLKPEYDMQAHDWPACEGPRWCGPDAAAPDWRLQKLRKL